MLIKIYIYHYDGSDDESDGESEHPLLLNAPTSVMIYVYAVEEIRRLT